MNKSLQIFKLCVYHDNGNRRGWVKGWSGSDAQARTKAARIIKENAWVEGIEIWCDGIRCGYVPVKVA